MFDRDRLQLIALGGLVAIVFVAAWLAISEQDYRSHDCDEGAGKRCQSTSRNWPESVVPHVSHTKTPPTDPKPLRNDWRAERDLEAQWETAKWTRLAALFALVGLVVTAVGIYYVRRTLQTNIALVDQAAQANAIARMMGEAQVRAYLTLAKVVGFSEESILVLSISVSNSGNSPARDVAVECAISKIYAQLLSTEAYSSATLQFGAIRQGEDISKIFRTGLDVTELKIGALQSNPSPFFLGIRVTFLDVFDHTVQTTTEFIVQIHISDGVTAFDLLEMPVFARTLAKGPS